MFGSHDSLELSTFGKRRHIVDGQNAAPLGRRFIHVFKSGFIHSHWCLARVLSIHSMCCVSLELAFQNAQSSSGASSPGHESATPTIPRAVPTNGVESLRNGC